MNRLLALVALASFALPAFAGREEKAEPTIVANRGWGLVQIGATKNRVMAVLGEDPIIAKYTNNYYLDYREKGVQVSFSTKDNKVNAIFFYNKQKDSEHFATFQGKTAAGIGWGSSVQDVIKAYGKPIHEYSGQNGSLPWRRIVFKGIDFRFEYDKMVRIAIRAD
jgi:hypothetical protein